MVAPKVDINVLNKLGWGPAHHTGLDALSIMAYAIPDSLTSDGFSIPWNTQMSPLDREFIRKMYNQKRITVRHATNISSGITFQLNGIFTTLSKEEVVSVPVGSGSNTLQLWGCPDGCIWSSYNTTQNLWYKIVSDPDHPNDLRFEEDL